MITLNCIEVNGSYKARRVLAEDVVEFCIGELMPRMKTLWVDVRLKSMIGEDATGFCWEGADQPAKMAEKLDKQLWLCKDGKYRNYTNCSYMRQPWEVEAYRMQSGLLKKFKESNYYVK